MRCQTCLTPSSCCPNILRHLSTYLHASFLFLIKNCCQCDERYIFKSSIEIQIYMCQLIQSKTWRWRHDQYWSSSFATLKSVFHLESILLAATLPSILFFIDLCNYWGKEPPQPKIWYIFLVGFLIKKVKVKWWFSNVSLVALGMS